MRDRFLTIYLNDQLAVAVVWRELARRAQHSNDGTELGDVLAQVARAIAEDVTTLESIMAQAGVARSRVKPALAIGAERAGRLKLNGRLTSYSPLSRFVELDALVMGLEAKRILWENLRDLAGLGEKLPGVDFAALIERVAQQRSQLEPFHRGSGHAVLTTG